MNDDRQKDLLGRLASDDLAALGPLLRAHSPTILGVATNVLRGVGSVIDVELVFDVVADRLWERRHRLRDDTERVDLARIVAQYTKDAARVVRRRLKGRQDLRARFYRPRTREPSGEDEILLRLEVERIMSGWPSEQVELFTRVVVDNVSYRDLAERFGASEGALRVRVARLRSELREALMKK